MEVSPKLRLLGAVASDTLHGGDVSQAFVSRFERYVAVQALVPAPDILTSVPHVAPGAYDKEAVIVDLFGAPGAFNSLWDRPLLVGGRAKVEPGLLRAHLARHNKIVIRNAPLHDAIFAEEFRAFLRGDRIDLMGSLALAPGQSVLFSNGYTDAEVAVACARAGLQRTGSDTDAYVIHERNFANLFAQASLRMGQLESTRGALETLPGDVKLRVVAELPPAQWLQLMHTPHGRRIMVDPDVPVPHWMNLPSVKQFSPSFELLKSPDDFQAIKTGIATQVSTDDMVATSAALIRAFPDALVLDITPDMSVDDLLFTLRKVPSGYIWKRKAMWRALSDGQTIVLRRLSCNRNLAVDLAGLCTGRPASLHLADADVGVSGRFILLEDTQAFLRVGEHRWDAAAADRLQHCQHELRSEHPFVDAAWLQRALCFIEAVTSSKVLIQRLAGGSPSAWAMMTRMARLEAHLRRNVTTPPVANALQRQAACDSVQGSLQDDPELAAYARVCARLACPDVDGRAPGVDPEGFARHYAPGRLWRAALCLNDAALREMRVRAGALGFNSVTWQDWAQQSYNSIEAAKKTKSDCEVRVVWGKQTLVLARHRAPAVVGGAQTWQQKWAQRVSLCRDALIRCPACSLQGPPGSGKSYMAQVIARELGARVFGPLSLGGHTRREDLLGSADRQSDCIVFVDGAVATWARDDAPGIKLLIVDEANLPEPEFWNFLRPLFDTAPALLIDGEKVPLSREHKVIFTGNADTMPGRHTHPLVKNHFANFYFEPFCDAFLDHIAESSIKRVLGAMAPANALTLRISLGDALRHLRNLAPSLTISPRNVEEAAIRCAALLDAHPSLAVSTVAGQAARDAWGGLLPAQTQQAWNAWLALMLGAARDSRAAVTRVDSLETGEDPMALTPSTRVCAQAIANFLEVRNWRLANSNPTLGQIGFLISGPSGRGKDELVMRLCATAGFEVVGLNDGHAEAPSTSAGDRRLFTINAGLKFDHLRRTIEQARELGALVLISELNLLPSALLEGELNACLTGTAAPGFAVFATINPDDFVGREQLSEAIGNRFVHHRLAAYTALELSMIVQQRLAGQADEHVEGLVAFHQACIGRASAAHLAIMPTARELLRVCTAMPPACTTIQRDAIIHETYAVYLATVPAKTPPAPPVLEDPHLGAYRCLVNWLCAPTHMQVVRGTEDAAQHRTDAALRLVVLPPWHDSDLDDHGDLGYLGWAAMRVRLDAALGMAPLADVAEAATHRLARYIFKAFGTCETPLEEVFPAAANLDACIASLRATSTQRQAFAAALRMELLYPGRTEALADLVPKAAREILERAQTCAHEVTQACESTPVGPVAHFAAAVWPVEQALARARATWAGIEERTGWSSMVPSVPWERLIPQMKMPIKRPRLPDIGTPKLPRLPEAPWLKKLGKGLGIGAGVAVGLPVAAVAGAIAVAASPVLIAGYAVGAATGHGLETGRSAIQKAGPYRTVPAVEDLRQNDIPRLEDLKRRFVDGSLACPSSPYDRLGRRNDDFVPLRATACSQFSERQRGWYLVDGYLSHFDAHANLTSAPDRGLSLVNRWSAPSRIAAPVMQMDVEVTSERRPMHKGRAVVRLATLPNTRPIFRGHDVYELSDGSYAVLLPLRGSVLHPQTGSFRYSLVPEPGAATPKVVPPLGWAINYSAWPELRAFLQTLPRKPESASPLCVWLRENVVFDRGREVHRRYLATGEPCPVNRLLHVRRGSGFEVTTAFVAIARDYLGLHVRAAVGRYAPMHKIRRPQPPPQAVARPMHSRVFQSPDRSPSVSETLEKVPAFVAQVDPPPPPPQYEDGWASPTFQDVHIWAEVHNPGRGWVTFDPTPRRLSTQWRQNVNLSELGPLLGRFADVEEIPVVAHRRQPKRPLKAPGRNAASPAQQAALVTHLIEALGPKLFETTLQPAAKFTASPPGLLDVLRLAAGDLKPFVACDVGRKPRARKLIFSSLDISAQTPEIRGRPDLGSRPVWDAIFAMGVHVDVMCTDGGIIEVTDTNSLFACAESCEWVRARAVHAEVDAQRDSKRLYAGITLQDVKHALMAMPRSECRVADMARGRLFKGARARYYRNYDPLRRDLSTKLTPSTVRDLDDAALASIVSARFKHMSCADVTRTLMRMPRLEYLKVQNTGRFTPTLSIPFLPLLRHIDTLGAKHIKTVDMQFVPGDSYVPGYVAGVRVVAHTDQRHLLARDGDRNVTYEYTEQPVVVDASM